jgi:CBS domain-containing membrane protein
MRISSDVVTLGRCRGRHPRFEGIREVEAAIGGGARGCTGPDDALASALLRCQKGGRLHDAEECLFCPRFVNFVPSPGAARITIRCLWRESDPAAAIMTRTSALVTVPPTAQVDWADELARAAGIEHLLVVEGDELRGVLCRCDLLQPPEDGETVAERMTAPVIALPVVEATLGDVAAVMREHRIGCVPIVDRWHLYGVVTRGDLRRVGIDEDLFGVARCASCGSEHGIHPDPQRGDAVAYCLECLELSRSPVVYGELGGSG